jgi:site-specific DNA recombinase
MKCAIYTRKSTSEGLEQNFNTLDAQREACENYVLSQKHEGWIVLPEFYDDGGFTGANMERPALKKLINDIESKKVDCIVVYKVDRLSRSLLDFVKLLEYFDKKKITFVSVTQHFNTNNSMGRLTLNILLSFAQFEREIISERTKDKISAARKRGQWTGGYPILGYDIRDKKLIINEKEADLVKIIFNTYLKECSLLKVLNILNKKGYKTKIHIGKSGKSFGGKSYDKVDVSRILSNVLYVGKIKLRNEVYDGEQEGIISEELFYKVQSIKQGNFHKRDRIKTTQSVALLRHLLWCKSCNKIMAPTYNSRENKKYSYYICTHATKLGYNNCNVRSVKSYDIENSVLTCLKELIIKENISQASIVRSDLWESLFSYEKRRILNLIIKRVYYDGASEKIQIILNKEGLKELADEVRV